MRGSLSRITPRPSLAEQRLGNRARLKRLDVDVGGFDDRDEALRAEAASKWKAIRRRRNDVYPQPEEVLTSWVAPYTEIFPGQAEPTGGDSFREWLRASDYTAYKLEMYW